MTSGLLGLGDQVTWSARHFGWRWQLTSRINAYDRPRHFRDSMVWGAFKRFDHDHEFEQRDGVPKCEMCSTSPVLSDPSGGSPMRCWSPGTCARFLSAACASSSESQSPTTGHGFLRLTHSTVSPARLRRAADLLA